MGNVSSRSEDSPPLLLRDQYRLTVAKVTITNSRNRVLGIVTPNTFPATGFNIKKDADDDTPVEFIQDPEAVSTGAPSFLLRLSNDEDIFFYFTFAMRQTSPQSEPQNTTPLSGTDTSINSLTFLFASSPRELEALVTREFNADPNLHKNPNVELVGDYSTSGKPVEQFDWLWKWRSPKPDKDKGGGWRNFCSFVEYDQRLHRLNSLVSFSFWVQNIRPFGSPKTPSATLDLNIPTRLRVPSAQSLESRLSDSDTDVKELKEPPSPAPGIITIPENALEPSWSGNTVKVDLNYQKAGDDIAAVDDGPVFRASIKALEQKTGNMRIRMKQVLKKAEAAKDAQILYNRSFAGFMEALREASSSNANAVQPALDHYFDKVAKEILQYEKQNAENLQKLIIDPIAKLYSNDIKQVDSKKKDFEDESRDYYAYVGRYLGQRQDSLKEKKRAESDSKYQVKRRNFELKRFDYSTFMQDLHGGRKDQEVLSQLTRYADAQAKGYLETARKVDSMMPQLDALSSEVREADKEFQVQRREREEKRRTLEKTTRPYSEIDPASALMNTSPSDTETTVNNGLGYSSSVKERPTSGAPAGANVTGIQSTLDATSNSPGQDRFRGIRDLEERDSSLINASGAKDAPPRKEGLLWSLSRPGSYADPKGLNKQAWHKYWVVLDQGRLSEYVNWKDVLEQHREPIDLRIASVREARNVDRRFCFEVITPSYTRVYQAPSDDDVKVWIQAINNALQSAFETKAPPTQNNNSTTSSSSIGRDIFGKSSSFHGHRSSSTSNAQYSAKNVSRHATVGERPPLQRSRSSEDQPARLIKSIRDADPSNYRCADCGTESRVEWVSINLGIVLCIECSGIHRSLGTHITKIRSLTLDTISFTQDIIELILRVGNRVSNSVWEAMLDHSSDTKPGPMASRDHRLRFITAKYVDRAFVTPIVSSRFATADETLLASIKKDDLANVLYALAARASPNAADRSRSTHAVFLALAASDPAAPASSTAAQPSSSSTEAEQKRKSFAMAELLLQNGADIPSQPAPIPLSRSAQMYVDFKRNQRFGRGTPQTSNSPQTSTGNRVSNVDPNPAENNGDRLTALPRFDGTSDARDRQSKRTSSGAAGAVGKLMKTTSPGT